MITCFKITFTFSADLTVEQRNELLDKFIRNAIEANGLQFGGGGSDNIWDGTAEPGGETDEVSEAQRSSVIAWLKNEPRVLHYFVGERYEEKPIDDIFVAKLERITKAMEAGLPNDEIKRMVDELED